MSEVVKEKIIVRRGGVTGLELLLLMFIGLKLTGYIDWSWFWVLSPLWIPLALGVVFVVGTLLVSVAIIAFAFVMNWWKNR